MEKLWLNEYKERQQESKESVCVCVYVILHCVLMCP